MGSLGFLKVVSQLFPFCLILCKIANEEQNFSYTPNAKQSGSELMHSYCWGIPMPELHTVQGSSLRVTAPISYSTQLWGLNEVHPPAHPNKTSLQLGSGEGFQTLSKYPSLLSLYLLLVSSAECAWKLWPRYKKKNKPTKQTPTRYIVKVTQSVSQADTCYQIQPFPPCCTVYKVSGMHFKVSQQLYQIFLSRLLCMLDWFAQTCACHSSDGVQVLCTGLGNSLVHSMG